VSGFAKPTLTPLLPAVPFRHGERIGFSYLVSQKYTGENAHVKILRGAKLKEFDIDLANQKRLVPAHIKGKPPSYYIIAGIVFAAVSVPYLRSEVSIHSTRVSPERCIFYSLS
jgi:hypothetical protein